MIGQKLTPTPIVVASIEPVITPAPYGTASLKRLCDIAFGLTLAAFALPVVAIVWAAVRLTSAGPGFYSQLRVGLNGRTYRIYKIRTMTHNCEAGSGAQWATKCDPRITPVGRILRKLHLDELPQLWNVLKGDMSLVGPRPERPEFVVPLSAEIAGYTDRQKVKPGVTGLAQIQLPADTDIESVRTKLVLDRCYIQNAGFWLDLRIMLGTVVYLIGFSYARVRHLMRLPSPLAKKMRSDDTKDRVVVLGSIKLKADANTLLASQKFEGKPAPCGEAQ